ncbi:MAG: hypothetical protein AAGA10_25975 [Bacteroidota bacterium]
MKTLRTISLFLLLPIGLCAQQVPVLEGIQGTIERVFMESMITQENKLRPLIENLATVHAEMPNSWLVYWEGYGHYYEGIYFMEMDQKSAGIETLKQGIELVESQEKMNAEDHVLAGTLMSLQMGLSPGSIMTLSSKSNKHFQQALKLAPNNLRAYLALGRSDYYKPKMFGGGKKVEEYFKKALSLEDSYSDDPYAPSWGRVDTYAMLVQYYAREERGDEAKVYCKKGLALFPSDPRLNELDSKL